MNSFLAVLYLVGGLLLLWKSAGALVDGAVELLICCKVIEKSLIPPTINLEEVDEQCDPKMDFVPLKAKEQKVDFTLSNSLGFGGHNACLVLGKV